MNLIYFTVEAYKALKRDLNNNKDNYYKEDEWLPSYFAELGINEFYKTSSITVEDVYLMPPSGDDNDSKNVADLNNIKRFYDAYKDKITPLQASDPLLWSALCHIHYREYVFNRWKKDDGTVRLNERFFASEGRTSLVYYNAISRLWWSGYLTYDETSSNPFYLTETLLTAQQIQKDLFDQSFSMNRVIVKGLLTALRRIQDENGNSCTPIFRKCCHSYLNHYGAVSILDALESNEIEEIAYSYMKKLIKTSTSESN